ncbi:MAG: hypothetical protein K6D02_03635 [Lachnospiraceae bacterium]|nr:hypothetical protein [Lachnospiraceae bacterium]
MSEMNDAKTSADSSGNENVNVSGGSATLGLKKYISPTMFKELKSGMGFLIFYSLLFFIITVVYLIGANDSFMDLKNNVNETISGVDLFKYYLDYTYYNQTVNLYCSGAIIVILGFLSIIEAIRNFSFLGDRRKGDFYFSQPVTRVNLYITNFVKGIINVMLPVTVFYLIGIVATLSMGQRYGVHDCSVIIVPILQFYVLLFMAYIMFYLLNIIAILLTGRMFTSVCMTGFMHLVLVVGYGLSTMIFDNKPTVEVVNYEINGRIVDKINIIFNKFLFRFSPVTYISRIYEDYFYNKFFYSERYISGNGEETSVDIIRQTPTMDIFPLEAIYIIAIIAILAVVGIMLMNRRKAEMTESAFTYPIVEDVVQGIITVYGGVLLGVLFYEMLSEAQFALGAILGGLISFFVVGFICKLDYKEVFVKKKIPTLVVSAVVLVIATIAFYA